MNEAIRVENVSKQYRLGLTGGSNTSFREMLTSVMTLGFLRKKPAPEILWALREVSFSVAHGETVGIIGRNGAGKSTLLKILSHVTYPTSGKVIAEGRLAALLEVGTGFHPELTGRENIYLNGSILGMSKKEVDKKMESIIEFSGVERFLDTPIKRYSSGMRLRLGFAVAAHLDPDILIVDEVLAVGDAAFQKKCLNAMGDMRKGARTVLFVSHNLAAVEHLCSRCIWIDAGRVRMDGESGTVIKEYMGSMVGGSAAGADLSDASNRRGSGKFRFTGVEFLSPDGNPQKVVRAGDAVVMRFHYAASEAVANPSIGFRMYTEMGTVVTTTSTWHHAINIPVIEPGDGYLDLELESLNLFPSVYSISLWATCDEGKVIYDNVEHAVRLEVDVADVYDSGRTLTAKDGIVFFPQKWNLSGLNAGKRGSAVFTPDQFEQLPK